MNWGKSITLSFILFIALIATLVTISMRQDINLVTEDYYKQEIAYQDQIERLKRTRLLENQPEISLDRKASTISIDLKQQKVEEGKAVFYRPSDAAQDRILTLSDISGNVVSFENWQRGLWKIQISWTSDGLEYYSEKIITL